MNYKNFFSILILASGFVLIGNGAYAQSKAKLKSTDKTEVVEKKASEKEKEVKDKEEEFTLVYSVMEVIEKDGKYAVELKESNDELTRKLNTSTGSDMSLKVKANAQAMKSEADVLNYISQLGYELVSVVSESGKEGGKKSFYLKRKVKL